MKQIKLSLYLGILILASLLGLGLWSIVKSYAAPSEYHFDFGGNGTQSGFIGVSASDGYDKSKGYGFQSTGNMANVSASGSGELSDAVQFKSTDTSNTFNVDLDNGLYEITVYLGNTNRTSIWAEGCLQVINMTGNNATHTWQMPVTDGQLNIMATNGKEGYPHTMSALHIKKISSDPTMKPTVWLCGDSTVCNYYPLDSSTQAGWGQVLGQYIDTNKWEIRNMASSGQCARGFRDYGQFAAIMQYAKKGDIYIISIGINDTNSKNETTAEQYHDIIADMTKQALAKGMQVYLVQQQGRAGDVSLSKRLTGRWYNGELAKVGEELNVPVIDLFNKALDYFISIGQDATTNLYISDGLHPNRQGAQVLAKIIAENVDWSGETKATTQTTTQAVTQVTTQAATQAEIPEDPNPDEERYYAVNADYTEGVEETTNKGFRGRAYVNLDNKSGTQITWHVRTQEAGNYLCTFRIANGVTTDRAMLITVNEGSDQWLQPFLPTGAWTTWQERGIVLPLRAGVNKITAVSTTSDGAPNFDYMKIELTDEPIAETYDPNATTEAPKPTEQTTEQQTNTHSIYIAGDSTCQSYRASYAPQQGWGYYLQEFVPAGFTVKNHAIAGRSSKSFYDNGRLQTILDEIQKDDYLLVQFGINDSAYNNAERYAPVCGKVADATEGSFEYYIKYYVEGALDKNAKPVLISPTLGMKAYSNGKFVNSYTNYAGAMKNIADYYKISYIDLNSLMVNDYNNIGYDKAKLYHLMGVVDGSTDGTHFSEEGAKNAAKLVSSQLNSLLK